MADWLRKLIENLLPFLVEEGTTRRVLYWLFWTTTVLMSLAFIVTNPVFGWFVALAPVVLVWRTSRRGLARVNGLLLGAVLTLALVPAFFLGMAQATTSEMNGYMVFGLVVFLVWVAAFPTMLDHVDRYFRAARFGAMGPDPFVEYRLLLIRLWTAAVIMLVVDEALVAVICGAALAYRRNWTAAVAGVACLLFPLLSFEYGRLVWDADGFDVVAALMAGYQWVSAIRNPEWGGGLVGRLVRAGRQW